MGYQVDVWSGDLHQRHSASQDFEEWQPATDYMAEQIEAGMLCNVLHTDFKAPPSRGAEAIDALLETLERHEKLIIEGQGVSDERRLSLGQPADESSVVDGATLKVFYQDMWPKGVYVDDLPLSVEDEQGRWVMADSDTIALSALGFIGANDKQAFTELGWDDRLQYSPVDLWNKVMEGVSQKVVVSLTVAPDKLEALLRAAEDIGADIISPTSE